MISIITPVYNGEKFIESCIKVVIDQNCPDVEHIIMDGGSSDGTVDIIKQYAEKHPHIRWVSEKDKGQSDAMNKGIAMAKGEILNILNVDDYYEPNVLNRILKLFESLPEPCFLVGNCNMWIDGGKLIKVNKPAKLKLSELLLGSNINPHPVNPSAYFYHTSLHQVIGEYKVDEHYVMDLDFIFRAVQVAEVRYVNETWGNYRMIEGTKTVTEWNSGRGIQRAEEILKYYRKQLPFIKRYQVAVIYSTSKSFDNIKSKLRIVKKYLSKSRAILF